MTHYFYDGKEISHAEFIGKGIAARALPSVAPRRCSYWQLLNENAQKGHPKSVEFLKHLTIKED